MYIRVCVKGFEEVGGIDGLEEISGLVLPQSKTQLAGRTFLTSNPREKMPSKSWENPASDSSRLVPLFTA